MPGAGGIQLLDDQAARYGEFDDVTLVGWSSTMARTAAAEHLLPAGAAEVARLAVGKRSPRGGGRAVSRSARLRVRAHVSVSTFTLDDEALVTRSLQLDEIAARAAVERAERCRPRRDGYLPR